MKTQKTLGQLYLDYCESVNGCDCTLETACLDAFVERLSHYKTPEDVFRFEHYEEDLSTFQVIWLEDFVYACMEVC